MADIVYADSWLMRRRFCLFPSKIIGKSSCFYEDALRRKVNVLPDNGQGLRRFPHALLMAFERKRLVARMLTGVDADGTGYFSLFEALENEQAVKEMLDEAIQWQQVNGGKSLMGPIAPDMLDLEAGILKEGFGEEAAFGDRIHPLYYGEFLERYGFKRESEWLTYRLDVSQCDKKNIRQLPNG